MFMEWYTEDYSQKQVYAVFVKYDADGSGLLSPTELRMLLKDLCEVRPMIRFPLLAAPGLQTLRIRAGSCVLSIKTCFLTANDKWFLCGSRGSVRESEQLRCCGCQSLQASVPLQVSTTATL